jgi:probable rRNA maturation factor
VSGTIVIRNRQRSRAVNRGRLADVATVLLRDLLQRQSFHLGIYLVGRKEMSHLNGTFLQHEGPTDVITFDYGETQGRPELHGEIFVCVDEAVAQAKTFRTTWQKELARYTIHGVLHLCGYDDERPAARRRMKLEEDRRLEQLARRMDLSILGRAGRNPGRKGQAP